MANEPEILETATGQTSALTELLAFHRYYCCSANYYSNEAGAQWETMTDFLDTFENTDEDMNFVFRWDVGEYNNGKHYVEVFIIKQRNGIFSPNYIRSINEDEAKRFRAYLDRHWEIMKNIWMPLSANAELSRAAQALNEADDGKASA